MTEKDSQPSTPGTEAASDLTMPKIDLRELQDVLPAGQPAAELPPLNVPMPEGTDPHAAPTVEITAPEAMGSAPAPAAAETPVRQPDLTLTNINVAELTAEPAEVPKEPQAPVAESATTVPTPTVPEVSSPAETQTFAKTDVMAVPPIEPAQPVDEGVPPAKSAEAPIVSQDVRIMRIAPEVLYFKMEKAVQGDAEFHQELVDAKAKADTEPQLYGKLGSQEQPLTDASFADAVVRSLFNDTGEAAWVKIADQVVKVQATEGQYTIWKTYTDEQLQAGAPGMNWEEIKKLQRELAASGLKAIDAPKAS